jgi:CDP-diacylglycerol--serine O-phosphatidyltransferase
MKLKNNIPNFITLLNLFCGCLAIVASFKSDLVLASVFVFIGAFFDYIDGLAARLLNARSEIGKELDSLADIVTFGVVPSIIVYQLLQNYSFDCPFLDKYKAMNYFPFIIAIFSAIRLAKYNIDNRQTISFLGLPTPANAIFWASAPIIIFQYENNLSYNFLNSYFAYIFHNPYYLMLLTLVFAVLLVVEIPLFSIKFKDFSWSNNKIRYYFLALAIVLIIFFQFTALPLIIILYVLMSVIHHYYLL